MAFAVHRLSVPNLKSDVETDAVRSAIDGFRFIARNRIFSWLIGMSFFNSFFGMSYVILMPVFAVDILDVGAEGQGMLLSAGGVGALASTVWLSSLGNAAAKKPVLVVGATLAGLSIVAFGLTAKFIGSYPLALAMMFVNGIFTAAYMISIMSSLQLMVPDNLRGRVMGFYTLTWSIMPLGGMQAGAIANFIGAPFAVAIGGLAVSAFALGPGLVNRQISNLGTLVQQSETTTLNQEPQVAGYSEHDLRFRPADPNASGGAGPSE